MENKTRRIKLSNCNRYTIVDEKYYQLLKKHKWYMSSKERGLYAATRMGSKEIYMHALIIGSKITTANNVTIDHINGKYLDNREDNLRFCTTSQNGQNRSKKVGKTSKYFGVSVYNQSVNRPWQASICKDRKHYWLGSHKTQKDAAKAYDKKALELFGENARVNFK